MRGRLEVRRLFSRSAITTVLVGALLSLCLVSPAAADQPVSATFTESFSEVFATCGGFDVIDDVTLHGRDTVYFDRDGHAVRHVVHLRFKGTFTNSVTGAVLSPTHGAFMIDEGLENPDATNEGPRPGTFRIIGLSFHMRLEGRPVTIDAGQFFVDLHDYYDPFDDEVIRNVGRQDRANGFDICTALD